DAHAREQLRARLVRDVPDGEVPGEPLGDVERVVARVDVVDVREVEPVDVDEGGQVRGVDDVDAAAAGVEDVEVARALVHVHVVRRDDAVGVDVGDGGRGGEAAEVDDHEPLVGPVALGDGEGVVPEHAHVAPVVRGAEVLRPPHRRDHLHQRDLHDGD